MGEAKGGRLPPLVGLRQRFGARLRTLRRARQLSQEDLALLAGIDRTYVSSVERGRRNISLDNIGRLADALGLPVRELLPDGRGQGPAGGSPVEGRLG